MIVPHITHLKIIEKTLCTVQFSVQFDWLIDIFILGRVVWVSVDWSCCCQLNLKLLNFSYKSSLWKVLKLTPSSFSPFERGNGRNLVDKTLLKVMSFALSSKKSFNVWTFLQKKWMGMLTGLPSMTIKWTLDLLEGKLRRRETKRNLPMMRHTTYVTCALSFFAKDALFNWKHCSNGSLLGRLKSLMRIGFCVSVKPVGLLIHR